MAVSITSEFFAPPPRPTALARVSPARLFAVGGGKGGVGKSVVTASLGVAIARHRRRCTLVDADLGAANLHTLLGVARSPFGLSDFLANDVAQLGDVACRTDVPGLSLISGSRALVDMANLPHARKRKLVRHLERMDSDEVWIDLGAGTAFNVLDFFVAADRGLLVAQPEPTSLENSYAFLKAAFFRSLRPLMKDPEVRDAMDAALAAPRGDRLRTPREIVEAAAAHDATAGRRLADQAAAFRPAIVLNGVQGEDELVLGRQIASTCRRFLGIDVELLGTLPWDPEVSRAIRAHRPLSTLDPEGAFAREIDAIAARLVAGAPRPSTAPLPDDAPSPAPVGASPGQYLRGWRQRLGLSVDQAVAHTRIRKLEAIEDEHYADLPPEETYLRGMVLAYARALGAPRPEALAIKYLERYRFVQHRAAAPPARASG